MTKELRKEMMTRSKFKKSYNNRNYENECSDK